MTPTPEWIEADEDDDTRVRSTFDRADNTARLALEVADLKRQLASLTAERDEARATKDMHKERAEQMVAERDSLRAEVRDLRAKVAAVEAVVAQRDVKYPERFQFAAGDNHVAGYRAAQSDVRTALASVGRTEPEGAGD